MGMSILYLNAKILVTRGRSLLPMIKSEKSSPSCQHLSEKSRYVVFHCFGVCFSSLNIEREHHHCRRSKCDYTKAYVIRLYWLTSSSCCVHSYCEGLKEVTIEYVYEIGIGCLQGISTTPKTIF